MPAWATLAVAGLVGMAESSAVIQSATPGEVSRTGSVFGISRLTSPASAPTGPLTAWASLARTQPDLPAWLYWHFGFSCLFLAGYFMLAAAALRILAGRPVRARRGSPPRPVSATLGWRLLAVTGCGQLAVILVATACTAGPIASGQPPAKAWAWAIQVLAVLTWAAALWLIGWFCYRAWDERAALLPLAQAAKIQRFSLVIAALLIVIAIVPGTNTLEQMPDVQRAWFGAAGVATAALGAAIVAQVLLAFVMLNIGRLRVRRARQRVGAAAGRKPVPHYRGWILTSAAFLLVAGLAWISGQARISLAVAVIPGVLCAVALVSWIAGLVTGLFTGRALADVAPEPAAVTARAAHAGSAVVTEGAADAAAAPDAVTEPEPGAVGEAEPGAVAGADPDSVAEADPDATALHQAGQATHSSGPRVPAAPHLVATVLALGDGLAVAVLAIPGLGLVRSFTTPALLAHGSYLWFARAAVLAGLVLSVLSWLLVRQAVQVARRLKPVRWLEPRPGQFRPVVLYASSAIYAGVVLWLLRWPLQASARLGVVATATIVLGALAMVLAVLAHLVQNRVPLPIFRLIRLKTTPVLSILVVIGIIALGVGQNSGLHLISQNPAAKVAVRSSLAAQLTAWLQAPGSGCAPDLARGQGGQAVRVRPLVLVAAAGGGIRAAWWTAGALTLLADNDCGRQSVFAVSSVSGGSLGSAVVATAAGHGSALQDSVAATMHGLAEPPALASAIDGLVLRDTVAGLTGVTVRAAGMRAGPQFPDRAALVEQTWIETDQALGAPFLTRPAAAVPWQLLFNSTAVRSHCRAVIATAAVGPVSQPATHTPRCLDISGQPGGASGQAGGYNLPDAYDLLSRLPCLQHMSVATAVMLSARFAYVTPAGAVPGCEGANGLRPSAQQVEQYVDGGYSDASGLLTLQNVMPGLLAQVAQYNAAQLAAAAGPAPVPLVVPVVVYLANTPIVKPIAPQSLLPPAAEPEIPLTAGGAASGQLSSQTVLLQELAADISPSQWLPCAAGDSRCQDAARAATALVGSGVIVVAPRQQAGAFAVPLGWVLSLASQQSLTADLAAEADDPCNAAGSAIYCVPGTGDLHDLLTLTRPSG